MRRGYRVLSIYLCVIASGAISNFSHKKGVLYEFYFMQVLQLAFLTSLRCCCARLCNSILLTSRPHIQRSVVPLGFMSSLHSESFAGILHIINSAYTILIPDYNLNLIIRSIIKRSSYSPGAPCDLRHVKGCKSVSFREF